MIVDITVSNFRSFREEQMFSLSAERSFGRHPGNFSSFEEGKIHVLRSSAIFGANASGKSNLLRAFAAIRWLIISSTNRKEGQSIPPYEPFRLSKGNEEAPVNFEIEFIVPSGTRYRYFISFLRDKVVSEKLISYATRVPAVYFHRRRGDTWETMKFGGTYKGGSRRLPFFENVAYLSRAGNDASAPDSVREIYRYFDKITYVEADGHPMSRLAVTKPSMLRAVSELICLADTGVSEVTIEENEGIGDLKLPDSMPEDLKEAIIAENKFSAKFWVKGDAGTLIGFGSDEMSSGTNRLFELLPFVVDALLQGSVILIDEIDAHLHTDVILLVLRIFQDDTINRHGAQIVFTSHDTNLLDSAVLRRDQIWFVSKDEGVSVVQSLDEFDRNYVRHDSPFESFYRDGRLGALPRLSFRGVKKALLTLAESTGE